jgi:hypothetical protein
MTDSLKLSSGFYYGIEFSSMLDFHDVRVWLTKTYGEGYKCNPYDSNQGSNGKKWGYNLLYQRYIVFFLSEEEFAWFKLKFGEHKISDRIAW